MNGNLYEFANKYTGPLSELPKDFKVDKKVLDQFLNFLIEKKVSVSNNLTSKFESFEEDYNKSVTSAKTKKLIQDLKNALKKESKSEFDNNKKDIERLLNFEIRLRFISYKKLQRRIFKRRQNFKNCSEYY